MTKHKFDKMYTVKDLEYQVEVLNLQDVEKYESIINGVIKYLKKNKHEIVSSLAKSTSNDQNMKSFRFGDVISDPENGIMLEVHIYE